MTNAEAIDILNTYKKREETIWGRETDYAKVLKVAVNAKETRPDILDALCIGIGALEKRERESQKNAIL